MFTTGGRGSHGLGFNNVQGADPLFAQASVKVVGSMMVVVNAGSNTACLFDIDPTNPSDAQMVGHPVASGGEFPVSSTIDKVTGNVCVLNSGNVNGVK